MKVYVISGLGADFKVLEKIKFPDELEVQYLDWLIPEKNENFQHYVQRFSTLVDDSEPFYLLGYSFGGIIVQEIHKMKRAQKIVILGSIKSDAEKSAWIKLGKISRIPKILPISLFNEKSYQIYSIIRKWFDPKNPKILNYFTVRNPYYLKWSMDQISQWDNKELPDVIQIMGDKDIVFPLKYSKPDYIIKGGTHLFPATKHKEVSLILEKIFK